MKTLLRIVAALAVIGVVVLLAIIFVPAQLTGPTQQLAANWQPETGQGEYVARMADCAACHTDKGGRPFAGGLAIESPMGAIYASNITPDPETGIGNWSLDDFRAALVDGVTPNGTRLYPAMPYDSYRHMKEEDIRALYAYFMHDVPAVRSEVKTTSLDFPFNQRWGIRLWDWVNLGKAGPKESDDTPEGRGAYLVDALGHCGSCHTPRNAMMAQAATDPSDRKFLSGGEIDGWYAPDLRSKDAPAQKWSAEDLKAYLTTGRNSHTATGGEMALAVEHSLQYMSDEDADAMVKYLHQIGSHKSVARTEQPPSATGSRTQVAVLADPQDETSAKLKSGVDLSDGERLYMDNCAACHFTNGRGAPNVFPSLAGDSMVTAKQSKGLIHTILYGAEMPSTEKRPEKLRMPGFANRLSDEDVAKLASFVRSGWGNKAGAVSASDVADVRGDTPVSH